MHASSTLSALAPTAYTSAFSAVCKQPVTVVPLPDGRWGLEVVWKGERVILREAEPDELEDVLHLVYRVYVEELHLVRPDQLGEEQLRNRIKSDRFDCDSGTRHFVAVAGARIVGCIRLVQELDGILPLDENGFSLAPVRGRAGPCSELGKFMIEAKYRGGGLVDALFTLLWYVCRKEVGLDSVFLSCEPRLERLYHRVGARLIGRFQNREFGREYSAMRIDIAHDVEQQFSRSGTLRSHDATAVGSLSTEDISAALRKAYPGKKQRTVTGWRLEEISRGGGISTGGVYRICNITREAKSETAWSLVLKEVTAGHPGLAPEISACWRREPMAYQDGTLTSLPRGIRVPKCYGLVEGPGAVGLLLEDQGDESAERWGVSQFERAAYHLGRMNATYLARRPLPSGDWVSKRWLWEYVEGCAPQMAILPEVLQHPLVERLFSGDSANRLRKLWDARYSLFAALESAPATFCHLDAVRRNLFLRETPAGQELIAIDWASAGIGRLGQEVSTLVLGSILAFDAPCDDVEGFARSVCGAYVEGLAEVGWRGDEEVVRLGYAASAALRYTLYGVARLSVLLNPSLHSWAEKTIGRRLVDIIDRTALVREYALALGDEVLKRRPCTSPGRQSPRASEPVLPEESRYACLEHRKSAGSAEPSVECTTIETSGRSGSKYIMDGPHEAMRLEAKTDSAATLALLRSCGLRPGMRALDVGCGSGAVTRVMAEVTGPELIVGLDLSQERLGAAERFASGSAASPIWLVGRAYEMPFHAETFDFTWSRFLFEYLADPERALAEMVRVTRPGGVVAVGDLDGQISQFHPLPLELSEGIERALALLAGSGFDPSAGRKLFSHFVRAGLQDVAVKVVPYQVYAGGIPESQMGNWRLKVGTISRLLVEQTGEHDYWESIAAKLLAWFSTPEMFYHCSLIVVCGRVPEVPQSPYSTWRTNPR